MRSTHTRRRIVSSRTFIAGGTSEESHKQVPPVPFSPLPRQYLYPTHISAVTSKAEERDILGPKFGPGKTEERESAAKRPYLGPHLVESRLDSRHHYRASYPNTSTASLAAIHCDAITASPYVPPPPPLRHRRSSNPGPQPPFPIHENDSRLSAMSARHTRPTTPSLKLAATVVGGGPSGAGPVGAAMDPASPPQTPTSVSPMLTHDKSVAGIGHVPMYQNFARPLVRQGSNIRPVGTGHQFSYTRHPNANRFAQLSPRSSSEEEEEDGDEDEDEDDDVDDESSSESESATSRRPRSVDDDSDDEENGPQRGHMPSSFVQAPRPNYDDDSSEDEDEDDEEEYESEDEEPVLRPLRTPQPPASTASDRSASVAPNLVVEELSDYDPMNDNRSDIMKPTGIESPNSRRARSVSRGAASDSDSQSDREPTPTHVHQVPLTHRPRPAPHPDDADVDRIPELDRGMSNLNCTPEAEDDDDVADDFHDADAAALAEFAAAQREIRMRRRLSHGSSIGKRTHSERSDSDGEKDWTPLGDDVDMVGGSARRLRRRVGDRRSLLGFQDPPPERIEELEEPDSCAEDGWRASIAATRGLGGMFDGQSLARELPYYDLEIMEVDDE